MVFSDLEKRALEVFVTSAEDPIYAIRHTVPPEVFGAFGSYFSRNPKDFREHLLDAIRGAVDEEETDIGEENLCKLANGGFDDPSLAISAGLAKSQDFFKRWYGKYSHKSIANVVPVPIVATNVSQLFARELAHDQLAFFIEQSTRYVKWGLDKMFLDGRVMASGHAGQFTESLETSVQAYDRLSELADTHHREKIPFDDWKGWQSEEDLAKSDKFLTSKYSREIRGAALDVSRFLLPQACQTNIAWVLDARSTEFDISGWKGHPLAEMREAAQLLEKNAGELVPSLLKYTDENEYYSHNLGSVCETAHLVSPFEKGVDVISHDPDSLHMVLAHMFKRHAVGGTFGYHYDQVSGMSFDQKIDMLRQRVRDRGGHDEWIEFDEDFDAVKVEFEFRTDVGAVRDWRRHQKWDRGEGIYTMENGVHRPAVLDEMVSEAGDVFDTAIRIAHEAERAIRSDFPFQAQYVVPMATMHSLTMAGGLDQAQYMLWTRSTPQGNFSYREDAFHAAEALVRAHPWMLGYQSYPEGKEFMQVYEDAPLKGVLRLQTGETALHT